MKKLIIRNEGIDYDVKDQKDAVTAIIEESERFPESSMYDILASVEIVGFTVKEVFEIYTECIRISEHFSAIQEL